MDPHTGETAKALQRVGFSSTEQPVQLQDSSKLKTQSELESFCATEPCLHQSAELTLSLIC